MQNGCASPSPCLTSVDFMPFLHNLFFVIVSPEPIFCRVVIDSHWLMQNGSVSWVVWAIVFVRRHILCQLKTFSAVCMHLLKFFAGIWCIRCFIFGIFSIFFIHFSFNLPEALATGTDSSKPTILFTTFKQQKLRQYSPVQENVSVLFVINPCFFASC